MKRCSLLAMIIAAFSLAQLQAQSGDYVIRGDTLLSGEKVRYDPLRPTEVAFRSRKKGQQIFSADEVSEFGLKEDGGRVFRSFPLANGGQYQRFFLERLETGELELYHLASGHDRFYLFSDTLIPLDPVTFQHIIQLRTSYCPELKQQYQLIHYTKASLTYFVRAFNRKKCGNVPFVQFGGGVGYGQQELQLPAGIFPEILAAGRSLTATNLDLSLFIDQPIWKLPGLSLTNSIGFSQSLFAAELLSPRINQDIQIKLSNIQWSLTPRYTFDLRSVRPYLLAGGAVSYTIDPETKFLQATIDGSTVSIDYSDQLVPQPGIFYGFQYGGGIQLFYHFGHYLALEYSGNRLSSKEKYGLNANYLKIKVNL
ncbi:hypothetical protein [Flavilitoribacter nigricans]|uniref:Outer membrane protein beta-barrel domain-containing protein n=1 Tax=Flavilitoribacter nigricans (strain ATCC 23147 / DSM 23189 / NBRC 102662 / NCIMB 1420 / SS-2) TaxID=1122177 RepID=A0A2D0NBA7_FLAN2|nr:hypothetical protein [Flavilitoribacter nigricans]PHN05777.1 hypothetical protein CRP01_14990 [Flavilitoribacter nigricans DSM 23189 = NBRC 102662]